ncbi:protein FAM151B isoform X2 [Nilaparvata lugens]|uniref:protein FAM151B isoform X2 n=1 Tax=Nilaparvata lugens TaxID=108931 RepID=UPI00193CE627|nr:protein FAM151B isoform X2 [Nilaparvata lugens]
MQDSVSKDKVISVPAYFPNINNDLTRVTWAHAVNSRAKLNASLNDDSMMIEADILMGQLDGSPPGTNPIPIMGHPPQTTSDLSLEEFLTTILKSGKHKGIKLDFKSKEVFASSENIVEEVLNKPEADFPVWINADVLPGPGNSPVVPVDADYFVRTVVKKFPSAMLSVGWTTFINNQIEPYTHHDIGNMTDVLSRNSVIQPVTFPVRAALAAKSGALLTNLVRSSIPGTSLTIYNSNSSDKVDMAALRDLIHDLGKDKVYLDLSPEMMNELNQKGTGSVLSSASGLVFASIVCLLCINYYN